MPRLDADGAALLAALGEAGHVALSMPECLSLLARGVPDLDGIPWATTASREVRGMTDDGRPVATIVHAVPSRYPSKLPFPVGRREHAQAASGAFGPAATVAADAPPQALALARLGGAEARSAIAEMSRRTGKKVRVSCDDPADDEATEGTYLGFSTEERDGALVISTRAWSDGLAVRFLLAGDATAVEAVRPFRIDPLVAAGASLVRVPHEGAAPRIHLLREFAGRVVAVFPKRGRAMDSGEPMHDAAVLGDVSPVIRIEVDNDGEPFLRYDSEDVLRKAPPGCNAYWRTGQVAVEGGRTGFDVVFCRAAVDGSRRYRSQAEVEGDHDLAIAVADALSR